MVAPKKVVHRAARARLEADEVEAKLIKKFGRDIFINGADLRGWITPRASTGSLSLDIMYGGGLPLNVWNEIIGIQSSGKTSMIYKVIDTQQALDPDHFTLWVASEHFVSPWAETAGLDLGRMKLAETNVMEEAFETVIEYLDNRLCDAIVIDSFPALVPDDENDHGFDEWQMGLGARLFGKFFRKQSPVSKRSYTEEDRPCLLLIVNQWRENIGQMFGDPRTTPGGRAKDYWYSTRSEFARDEWITHDGTAKGRRVGIKMRAHTIKNKSAPVQRTGAVDFYFDDFEGQLPGHYDIGKDLFDAGMFTSMIDKRSSMYDFGGYTWKGEAAVQQALREDLDLRELLRFEVLRAVGVQGLEPPKVSAPAKIPARRPAARTAASQEAPVRRKQMSR